MTSGPIRVLLLEDDPADARLVRLMLRRFKAAAFEVTLVGRLSQALDHLGDADRRVDVVLADLTVPDSTGLATLTQITAVAPRLPVVVLTGNDDDALALEALKHGAQDYVVKGSGDGFVLSRVIRYAIERKAGEQALKEARDKAEQAARAKSVFLAMMGHEIRTPLNGILGMARLLAGTRLDPQQRAYAAAVASSGEQLLGLVEDLLDVARLDAEGLTLDPVPFDPAAVVEAVRQLLAPPAAEKGLALHCAVEAGVGAVHGDPNRLRQVLLNLVGNAIKFTERGSVRVTVKPLAAPVLRFTVVDSGIGIPAAAHPHVYDEFWQGDAFSRRRHGGAGLGLAICRRLVVLMGGTIDFDSAPGAGTSFRVDLPLPPAPAPVFAPAAVAPVVAVGAGVPRRVLLVDDNPVNRAVAAGLLEARGHAVVVAADGGAAVEAARAGGFDLVLMDMQMPGMDGIAAARAIRALPGAAGRMAITLLTANLAAEDQPRWRRAGVDGCLGKPFRVEQVEQVLAGLDAAPDPDAPDPDAPDPDAPDPDAPDGDALDGDALDADRADLGAERMAALAALFRESSAIDLAAALDHAAAGRLPELAVVAHRMASAAAAVHLRRLADHCRRVEDAARAGDAAAPGLAAELGPLWRNGVAALDSALG